MDTMDSESSNEDDSISNPTTPSASSATPFDPPPFSYPVGPVSLLESDATPFDFFSLFFDDDIMDHIVEQTNLYATQNPPSARYKWYPTCSDEIKLFLGMIIAMGVHRLPQLKDYWSSDILLGVPGIVDGTDRFKVLLQCLHLNDNAEMKTPGDPDYDRLHKLRPLLTKVKQNCLNQYNPHRQVSIDEAMVGFKGRSSLKQYMPMKPTKRGYKVWCLCDSTNGYLSNFDVYTGVSGTNVRDEGGLGPSVVKRLIEPFKGKGHFVFYDIFFSSVDLSKDLLSINTYTCGTARTNRRKFPDSLKKTSLKRGESKSELVEDSTVHCFVWQDKKAVSFINTIFHVTDECQVKRKNKDGSQALIPCPRAVKEYNSSMGGVDTADAKRKTYSCSRRSKKWWHRLFYFLLDICTVNAHIVQSETPHQTNLTQKEFRLELARELMSSYNARKHRKRGRNSTNASPSLVFSENHFPDKLEKPAQCRACSASGLRRRSSYCCKQCNAKQPIPLCVVPCFRIHHTK